jgi:hypothetical protein
MEEDVVSLAIPTVCGADILSDRNNSFIKCLTKGSGDKTSPSGSTFGKIKN